MKLFLFFLRNELETEKLSGSDALEAGGMRCVIWVRNSSEPYPGSFLLRFYRRMKIAKQVRGGYEEDKNRVWSG